MADKVEYKTPNETIQIEGDLTDLLPSSDSSLTSPSATATDSTGEVATITSGVVASGLIITANVAGGDDGEDYLVRLKGTGNSSGNVRERVIEVRNRSQLVGAL